MVRGEIETKTWKKHVYVFYGWPLRILAFMLIWPKKTIHTYLYQLQLIVFKFSTSAVTMIGLEVGKYKIFVPYFQITLLWALQITMYRKGLAYENSICPYVILFNRYVQFFLSKYESIFFVTD